jgi:hypothetical protein
MLGVLGSVFSSTGVIIGTVNGTEVEEPQETAVEAGISGFINGTEVEEPQETVEEAGISGSVNGTEVEEPQEMAVEASVSDRGSENKTTDTLTPKDAIFMSAASASAFGAVLLQFLERFEKLGKHNEGFRKEIEELKKMKMKIAAGAIPIEPVAPTYVDNDGKPIPGAHMNDGGVIVDEKGEPIPDAKLQKGTFVDADGKPLENAIVKNGEIVDSKTGEAIPEASVKDPVPSADDLLKAVYKLLRKMQVIVRGRSYEAPEMSQNLQSQSQNESLQEVIKSRDDAKRDSFFLEGNKL